MSAATPVHCSSSTPMAIRSGAGSKTIASWQSSRSKGSSDIEVMEIAERDHDGIVESIAADDVTFEAMLAFIRSH